MSSSDAGSSETRRFRANPVEIVILLTVTLVFCNSIYNLFYDTRSFRPAALKPMAANPISEGRAPASTSSGFASVEVGCENGVAKDTAASKVRLVGQLCGAAAAGDTRAPASKDPVVKTTVLNQANKFAATVFADAKSMKFSTDYIPLNTGKNQIQLEFAFRSGKISTQEITISKF